MDNDYLIVSLLTVWLILSIYFSIKLFNYFLKFSTNSNLFKVILTILLGVLIFTIGALVFLINFFKAQYF